MSSLSGAPLLQSVADRIIFRYLEVAGYRDVSRGRGLSGTGPDGYDVAYRSGDRRMTAKIKPDVYSGTDMAKVRDRSLPYYRAQTGHYAFESIADPRTHEPGWMFNSTVDELFYYCIALTQTEDEIAALLSERDEVFFSELGVERDDLRILPMRATQDWFGEHYEDYAPRPVAVGDRSAWYRLVPCSDIDSAVRGIKRAGAIFGML